MKKTIPFILLSKIDAIIQEESNILKVEKPKDIFYHIKDADPESDFYFKIINQAIESGKISYKIEFKPTNVTTLQTYNGLVTDSDIGSFLKSWLGVVKSYNSFNSVYDDPILKAYEEKIIEQWHIDEADADYAPFDEERQLWLDTYLERVQEEVEKYRNIQTASTVDDIQNSVTELKESQGQLTKNKAVRALAKILAKIQKFRFPAHKNIYIKAKDEFFKWFFKKGLDTGYDYGSDMIDKMF